LGFRRQQRQAAPGVHFRQNRERRMKASDIDKEDMHPIASSSRQWLRVVGAAIAIVLTCFVWTFWN
jgi:hypothetical protein